MEHAGWNPAMSFVLKLYKLYCMMGGNMLKNTTDKKNLQVIWIGALLLVTGLISFLYWGNKKQVWFCDEIYTFESANGFEQDWPHSQTGEWMTGSDIEAYFAADSDHLSLNSITVRLYSDHVPLYFWLFRMVSFLFFKGSGTIWIGLSINLFFYLLFLGLGYWFFYRLTRQPLLSAAGIFLTCVINRLAIEQATVLRMYMMLLLVQSALLLTSLWILLESRRNQLSLKVFLCLYAVSVAGFLTHYDFWIFYAITAALFCLCLLYTAIKKQGKRMWQSREFKYILAWVVNFGVSLCTTIIIFPYCRWNLNRNKGQMALQSIFVFSSEKVENIIWGFRSLAASIFGEQCNPAIALLIIFGCIIGGMLILYKHKETEKLTGMVLTVLTAQAYQLAVCFTLPAEQEERYLWGSFTFIMLCFFWGGSLLLQEFFSWIKNMRIRNILQPFMSAVLIIGIILGELHIIDGGNGVAYLFHPEKDINLLQNYSTIPWIVYGPTVGVYSYYDWILPEKICFMTLDQTSEDAKAASALREENTFILYIYPDYLPEALLFLEQQTGKNHTARPLTKSTNLTVYLVESESLN